MNNICILNFTTHDGRYFSFIYQKQKEVVYKYKDGINLKRCQLDELEPNIQKHILWILSNNNPNDKSIFKHMNGINV